MNDYDVPAEINAMLTFILDLEIKKVCIILYPYPELPMLCVYGFEQD